MVCGRSGVRANGAAKVRGGAAWLKQRLFGQLPGSGQRLGAAHSGALDSDDSEATPNSRSHPAGVRGLNTKGDTVGRTNFTLYTTPSCGQRAGLPACLSTHSVTTAMLVCCNALCVLNLSLPVCISPEVPWTAALPCQMVAAPVPRCTGPEVPWTTALPCQMAAAPGSFGCGLKCPV